MDKWVVLDWESRSLCDLPKCGAYRYSIDPTTELLCGAWESHKGKRGLWVPGQPCPFPRDVLDTYIFVAHNALFEIWMWQNVATPDYGWPECPPVERWHDTQARALQLALPAKLDSVLKALKAPTEKDKEGSRLTVSLSKVNKKTGMLPEITPEIRQRVGAYCLNDIRDEMWLHRRLGWLPPHERPIWELAMETNMLGIGLDMEYVRSAQAIVDAASTPLVAEFKALTGFGPNQRDKVLAWVRERGVELADMQKGTLDRLLGSEDDQQSDDEDGAGDHEGSEDEGAHVELPPEVERALTIRQLVGSASIKKLGAMQACVGFDGRARGLLVYHGTTPGRQTAKIIQPHNFPRGSVLIKGLKGDAAPNPDQLVALIKARDPELLESVYGAGAVEIIASSLRHGIVAGPGAELLMGDYSGIQARSVLALAGQHDKCDLMASGVDVYIDMACDIWRELPRPDWAAGKEVFGAQVAAFKKAHTEERQTGKNSVLGLGFQMGAPKFHDKYCADEPFSFAELVVHTYRKEWAPCVPPLWYGLENAAVQAVWTGLPHEAYGVTYSLEDIWLVATIHNGSTLHYAYPERTRKKKVWLPDRARPTFWREDMGPIPEDAEVEEVKGFSYRVQKQGQWVTRDAFGGQLTENVIMKIEREIMEGAKRRLKAAGYLLPFEVHDEAIAERAKSRLDENEFKCIMEGVEDWVRRLRIPILVETSHGVRYHK